MNKNFKAKGFTLIEILVVIGMIAILATIVIIAINPGRQFASGRNTQRTSNVNAILNAIGQNIADNHGTFNCPGVILTAVPTNITSSSTVNIMPCLVPTYMPSVLADPQSGNGNSTTSYDSMYYVSKDSNNRYTLTATSTELGGQLISVTR
jgi:prepilin-type N-terminal cleavage/methylation domain-containing protein